MDLNSIDKIRKKCSKIIIIGAILFAIGIICSGIGNSSESSSSPIIGIIATIIGLIILLVGYVKFGKLKREFKTNYLLPLFKQTYPDCKYEIDKGITVNQANNSRIIPIRDRFASEDQISGIIDGVQFLTCDVKVEEMHTTTDSKGNTRTYYTTVFLGRYFEFEFNKEFTGKLVVTESKGSVNYSSLKKVEMESVIFNKKFKIFSSEDLTAFYILTPHIMERMMQIENQYKGKCSFSFIGSKMYMSINNNTDTFEISLFKTLNEENLLSFKKDIDTMKEVVNELKLNVNIFKKEI